ncbi:unnamed protein product [Linum tenue]|nr:unnamed protein product [Linum tenue]
MFLDLS